MKELIDILTNEEKSFDSMKWWWYAIICPIGLMVICAIAGTL